MHLIEDAFQCICTLSTIDGGKRMIYQSPHHGIQAICKGLTKVTEAERQLPPRLQTLNHAILAIRDAPLTDQADINQMVEDSLSAIAFLAEHFKTSVSMLKFNILETFITLFSSLKGLPFQKLVTGSEKWLDDIKEGIYSILSSKVTDKQRDPAIMLSGFMLQNFGSTWVIGKGQTAGVFFELLVHIVKIEIRMILEDSSLLQAKHALLSGCYWITENIIEVIGSSYEEGNRQFGLEKLSRIQQSLYEIFQSIVWYLQECKDKNATSDAIAYESARILGIWLSEDTETLHQEIIELLPFLLALQTDIK
jgi:hypothetical protein